MRIHKLTPAALLLCTGVMAQLSAQTPNVDTFWLRTSGAKFYKELKPFRKPDTRVEQAPGQLNDLMHDLRAMRNIAATADPMSVSFDETGREVVNDKKWQAAYERVKQNGLKMEGWLGKVFLEDASIQRRRDAAYGIFYFNDPQNIFHLISYLPGEPDEQTRLKGFRRAVEFLKVHLPKNKPQNPKHPENGVVVPKYDFNPLPFMQLLDVEKRRDQAEALIFLTEVLRCRRDLGKVFFDELREDIRTFLESDSNMLRVRASDLLAAIDPKPDRVPGPDATKAERLKWFTALDYELFPPIRHISSGVVELYPSEDLDEIVRVGKALLADKDTFPQATGKAKNHPMARYGVTLNVLPTELDKLGIPHKALIVAFNAQPTRNKKEFVRRIHEFFAARKKEAEDYQKHVKEARAKGKKPRPERNPGIQIEYIYGGKALMKEFRLMR